MRSTAQSADAGFRSTFIKPGETLARSPLGAYR